MINTLKHMLHHQRMVHKPQSLLKTLTVRFFHFFKVGRILFLIAFLGIVFGQYCSGSSNLSFSTEPTQWVIVFIATAIGKIMPIFAILDARSRFQDYKKAKDLFFKNGFNPKIANLFIHSKCQRDAALVAAGDLGVGPDLKRYYKKKGYRWYHILPDFTFKRPGIYFTITYWKATLFASNYKSEYFL